MLKKIVAIQNVGRFQNSRAPGNPELLRNTIVLGANGFGKSTLCAILRSLQGGRAAHIVGRQTLGSPGQPTVKLLVDGTFVEFNGQSWSAACPDIAIFDSVFVAENVHSADVVEVGHRRNLYRVIVGEGAVRLARQESQLVEEIREKTGEISARARRIEAEVPPGMSLGSFISLPADPDIDARIQEQERTVKALKQAEQISRRPLLSEMSLPALPDGFADLLATTIDDIERGAEARVAEHVKQHKMDAGGGNWIAEGLRHGDDSNCPFCGQSICGLPLIKAYRSVFSRRYRELRNEIRAMRKQVDELFGERAIGELNTLAEQNRNGVDFWRRYCSFEPGPCLLQDEIPDAIRGLRHSAARLLKRKVQAPLEPVDTSRRDFTVAASTYHDARSSVSKLSAAIRTTNKLLAAKKEETGAADLSAATVELARRKAIKLRHAKAMAGLCADHIRLTREKVGLEGQRSQVRSELDAHSRNVIRPYEQRINHYLESFNAGFEIRNTKHAYRGGTAASSYELVINNTSVALGDGRTPDTVPSFKNTLSSGDRTTLALAFFLAHLDRDQDLAEKVVVFDDPFSSQDAFRRSRTIHAIARIAQRCNQAITLSHDALFLRGVWNKAPSNQRVGLNLVDHGASGTKIMPLEVDRACQGRTATEIDRLQSFLTTGAGDPIDVIRKMRGVLETYLWTTYPGSFDAGHDELGAMLGKIRNGGGSHPAAGLYDRLDPLNDYSRDYHHGENPADGASEQIDGQELAGYVRETLKIVNAIQA